MEHVISIEEFHSRKVEGKEAGETSRGHDQPVILASATETLNITVEEKGSNSSVEEKFKKLTEAADNLLKRGTPHPKIRKVVFLRDHMIFKRYCEPKVISLGPIHHDEEKYRLSEEYKLVLVDDFIKESGHCGEDLYEIVKKKIKQLRECYDEEVTKKYSDEALAWILFVDGCATLQFIHSVVGKREKKFKIKQDHVAFVKQELFFLENQLPYQLLHYLMEKSNEKNLISSILRFINSKSKLEHDEHKCGKLKDMATNGKAIHLLDLLRKRLLTDQSCEDKSSENDQSAKKEEHSFHNAQAHKNAEKKANVCDSCRGICKKNRSNSIKDPHKFRNVQELKAVGILLKCNNSTCLGEIRFTKKGIGYPGILWLPPITIDDSTGPEFFNLIAYEMCPDFENNFGVTSYIVFLDSLIDEAKDVMDLRKAGILRNHLGSDEEVAKLFNEISTDLVDNFKIYKDVRSNIRAYYNKKWKTWISEGLHAHFSSPWTVMAFLAALFAVLATGVQTVYSILSYYK